MRLSTIRANGKKRGLRATAIEYGLIAAGISIAIIAIVNGLGPSQTYKPLTTQQSK